MNKKHLRDIIRESINDFIKADKITFRIDEISAYTLRKDKQHLEEDFKKKDFSHFNGKESERPTENYWIGQRKNWEINNYRRFLQIVDETPNNLKGFLTQHPMEEITQPDWICYTLKGYDVAFALHYIAPGKIDFCNFCNNSQLKGIGSEVLQFAKREGATQMDNYRGFSSEKDPQGNGKLGNLYRKNGFKRQTWHDKFDPTYMQDVPHDWRIDSYTEWSKNGEGKDYPDVEGLEIPRHRRKYDNESNPSYRNGFDKRMNKKFGKA